jgi:chromosome segregation ATPase
MGRAKAAEGSETEEVFEGDLGDATLEYADLYDLFASEFEDVALAGVLPFAGVVFAQLGTEDEAPAVSVDTRHAPGEAPTVFVVVARDGERDEDRALDPYAIVQLPEPSHERAAVSSGIDASAAAALQLRIEVLTAQLGESREAVVAGEARSSELSSRLDRAVTERDAALTRAMEFETILAASRQSLATLERRLLEAERGMLERDDQLATVNAELDARQSVAAADTRAGEELRERAARVESAEAALALNVADLAHVVEAHAAETAGYEEQLRDRARVIAELEREVVRREQLVKELVASIEELREGAPAVVFEAAVPLTVVPRRDPALEQEVERLRGKLDELAGEVARREGELTARAWRITELENERARPELASELARAQNELDALRQALAQEHAARVAAETGARSA